MTTKDLLSVGVVLSAKDMYHGIFDKAKRDLRLLNADAKDQAAKFERALTLGKGMVIAGATIGVASYAISQALEGIKQKAEDVDQAMADVSTVMQDLGRMPEFRAAAVEAASRSMFTSSQLLQEGAYNLLSAGLDEDEALAVLARVAQLGMGTFDSVAGAANNATTVMLSYKTAWKDMSAEEKAIRTTDALAKAIQLFKYQGPDLGITLQYTASAAAAANVPLEEMLATVGVMKNAGLEASMAGTSYRMMLERLPDLHKKTGMAVADATGKMRPLLDIMKELKAHYGDEMTVSELGELSDIFDVRAVGGVKALLLNLDELEKQMKAMGDSGGASFEMYERRMAGAGAKMKALRNEYDEASATLGVKLLPVMREKQKLLTQALELMDKIPGAKEALLGADIAAELGKLVTPLLEIAGMGLSWVTQRRIAIAVEHQLQLELAKTAAAGGGGGVVPTIAKTAAPGFLTMAGPVGAGLLAGGAQVAGSWMAGQAIAKKLGWMTFDEFRKGERGPGAGTKTVTVNIQPGAVVMHGTGNAKADARELARQLGGYLAEEAMRQ